MASVVKRGNSYSVVYMTTVQGIRKQKWETYHSEEAAKRRKHILEICKSNELEKMKQGVDTIEALMERYVSLYGKVKWSLSTLRSNYSLIQNYILPLIGAMRLHELSPLAVAELYHDILKQPKYNGPYHNGRGERIGPATLTSIHKLLHSAFEQAVLWEHISRNPFHRAALPTVRSQPCPFLRPEQISMVLAQCEKMWLCLALHLAFAGTLRKGEILALTWEDVDWKNNTVQVNKTMKRVSREAMEVLNRKDVLYEFPEVIQSKRTVLVLKKTKTLSSERVVYLPESLMKMLAEFYRRKSCVTCSELYPNLIFCYEDGRPIQETTLTRHFHIALEGAGLPRLSFHSLRHSSITYKLVLSGGDIKAVQGDSGHAQADMIIERYGHILEENRRNTSRRFEEVFYQRTDC